MEDNKSKIRTPYNYNIKHINDVYSNLGFDYSGKLFKKTISPEIYSNPMQRPLITKIEQMLFYLIETTKNIKKWFSIAHEKNSTRIK